MLLGRGSGFKSDDVNLQSFDETNAKVYAIYATTVMDSSMIINSTYIYLKHQILTHNVCYMFIARFVGLNVILAIRSSRKRYVVQLVLLNAR